MDTRRRDGGFGAAVDVEDAARGDPIVGAPDGDEGAAILSFGVELPELVADDRTVRAIALEDHEEEHVDDRARRAEEHVVRVGHDVVRVDGAGEGNAARPGDGEGRPRAGRCPDVRADETDAHVGIDRELAELGAKLVVGARARLGTLLFDEERELTRGGAFGALALGIGKHRAGLVHDGKRWLLAADTRAAQLVFCDGSRSSRRPVLRDRTGCAPIARRAHMHLLGKPLLGLVSVSMLLAAIALASCWTAPQPDFEEAAPALSHLPEPAGSNPNALSADASKAPMLVVAGIDTSGLDGLQGHVWTHLMNTLYAPCTDQAVSLAQCVTEARPCAACTPMAKLLAERIKGGASSSEAESAAAVRFGPDVKHVDLRDSPSLGPKEAPITIVMWSDFQCPHCKLGVPIIEKFQKDHGDTVKLVHKFYPLKKHPQARGAAIAAVAALRQNKYWEMEKIIFDNQDQLEPPDLEQYAHKVGLDLTTYRNDVANPQTEAVVDRDIADADAAGLNATPFILVNGRHFDLDYFKYKDLDEWVALDLDLIAKAAAASPSAAPKP